MFIHIAPNQPLLLNKTCRYCSYCDLLIAHRDELDHFIGWCEQHVPFWCEQGYDETWVHQRIEMAQITRNLHRTFKKQGLIDKYGYAPEDSAMPYVPVTIDDPQEYDAYYAKEYP